MVLKGDQRQGKTGVAAVPELEGNIEGGFREGITGSANLARSVALARAVNIVERRIGDKGVPNWSSKSFLMLQSFLG